MSHTRSVASSGRSYHQVYYQNYRNSRRNSEVDEYEQDLQRQRKAAVNSAEYEKTWKARCSECYDCGELIPHKLLYVCRSKRCYGYFDERNADYSTPFEFYEKEKVFCSVCSFDGSHKHHADDMEESHPLASKLASKDDIFQDQFRRLAFIDHDDPVDYAITQVFKVEELPVIAAVDYLATAKDPQEWNKRKKELMDFKAFVDQRRLEGTRFVREISEKCLRFYKHFVQIVEDTLAEDEERASRKETDKQKRRSGDSGMSSMSGSKPILEHIEQVVVVAAADSTVKIEEPSTPTENMPKKTTQEADDFTAKMICRSLSLHYDQIRDDMRIEHALQDVAEKLHLNTSTMENKMAAAKMFCDKHNVILLYPPTN
ncbi:hypothetical protein CAEBREN_01864 [Caenorhabditis brenneri]|uniref:Uncharacterized protein n=1 Tax=Caenorhabditis brenneri TaxID=135651 RepID=G0NVI4_CAEBE|nr:hypothetical protein CAEBREN_01864 [Caenorhabditis brenneri]